MAEKLLNLTLNNYSNQTFNLSYKNVPANKSWILLTLCYCVLNTEAANIKNMISFKYLLVNLIWIVQFLFQIKSLVTLSFQEKIILKSFSRTKSLLNENVYDNIPLVTPSPSIMTRNIHTLAK
jgi:hypothetical protein